MFPLNRKLHVQLALVAVAIVLLCCVSMVAQAAVDDDDLAGFPERPSMFRSPEELKEYLRALNEYFAIAGRPR
jgi:Pancreatic hormone peptide